MAGPTNLARDRSTKVLADSEPRVQTNAPANHQRRALQAHHERPRPADMKSHNVMRGPSSSQGTTIDEWDRFSTDGGSGALYEHASGCRRLQHMEGNAGPRCLPTCGWGPFLSLRGIVQPRPQPCLAALLSRPTLTLRLVNIDKQPGKGTQAWQSVAPQTGCAFFRPWSPPLTDPSIGGCFENSKPDC